jgi:membrane associated rhomboid family serine protease
MIPLHDDVRTRRFAVVTATIIAVNTLVFLFELSLPRHGLTLNGLFLRAGAIPYELTHQVDVPPHDFVPAWATVLTSLFLHGGWLHLIFNMLFLWIFGNNIEDTMGRLKFVLFYLLCGSIAGWTQALVGPGSMAPMIGASGAIAGVMGAYIVLFPRAHVLTVVPLVFFWPVFYLPAWVVLLAWFGLQFLEGTLSLGASTNVAFFAHIGGFVAGAVLVRLFVGRRRLRPA